jgi:hypothetical protein
MNKITLLYGLFVLAAGFHPVLAAEQSAQPLRTDSTKSIYLPVDTEQSVVKWRGTEIHEGILKLREGHQVLEGGQLTSVFFSTILLLLNQ